MEGYTKMLKCEYTEYYNYGFKEIIFKRNNVNLTYTDAI